MPRRSPKSALEKWEVALVKTMISRGGYNDQKILSYFTRPTRSVNHRVISEIRTEAKHKSVRAASNDELDAFLAAWPNVDHETGLSLHSDELLIKAREAMIAAVHIFNSAGLTFRAELFIVTAIIAWTYLMHAFFRREGIDYRYYRNVNGVREIERTKNGAEKYWELGQCLRHARCPLPTGTKKNIELILEIRHEVEHRSTSRIDDAISAALQASCINFNDAIKDIFGKQYGLERRLPIALQFVTFDADQRAALKKAANLPQHIATMMTDFIDGLSDDEIADPRFTYRVAFVPKVANRASAADMAVHFVQAGSEEADEINRVLLKEVEKPKYKPSQIVTKIREDGYPKFSMHYHTQLWHSLDAQNPAKGLGVRMIDGQWYWYENWLARVRAHCEENAERYR